MDKKEYIVFKGSEFAIEWYYNSSGKSQALEYMMKLSAPMQQKAFYLFKRMGDFGKISDKTKFRNEGDQIFAFKPKPDRFLSFFVKGKKIIVTNAFQKKSNKLPKNEKSKALECRKDYLNRVKEGSYYEE